MSTGLGRWVLEMTARGGISPLRQARDLKRGVVPQSMPGVPRQTHPATPPVAPPDGGLGVMFGAGAPAAPPVAPPKTTVTPPAVPLPAVTGADLYDEWVKGMNAPRAEGETSAPIVYGRSDGKYSGYDAKADLQSAIKGTAYDLQARSLQEALALEDRAAAARSQYGADAYDSIRTNFGKASQNLPTYGEYGADHPGFLDAAYQQYLATAQRLSSGNPGRMPTKEEFARFNLSPGTNVTYDAPFEVMRQDVVPYPDIGGNPLGEYNQGWNEILTAPSGKIPLAEALKVYGDIANIPEEQKHLIDFGGDAQLGRQYGPPTGADMTYVPGVTTPAAQGGGSRVTRSRQTLYKPETLNVFGEIGPGGGITRTGTAAPGSSIGAPGSMWNQAVTEAGVQDLPGQVRDWQKQANEAWDPYLELANQVYGRMPSDYAQQVASEAYGVAPELAREWFDAAYDNSVLNAERDQMSWQDNGAPFSEVEAERRRAEAEAAAAAEQQQQLADDNQQAQVADAVWQDYRFNLADMEKTANMTGDQILEVIYEPDGTFERAYDMIMQAVDPDTNKVNTEALDAGLRYALINDPTGSWPILRNLFRQYLPTDETVLLGQ